jgi:LacI family transcriptional regulator
VNDRATANIYDVAARAGVSIATVSRVLGGTGPVAATTRQRVLDAAEALRWRPNEVARALVAGGRFGVIGVVFPELGGQYYPEVLAGFEDVAVHNERGVLILATHGRANSVDLATGLAQRVDGLVVMDQTIPDEVVVALDHAGTAVVLMARPSVADIPAVRAENLRTATALATHLLRRGHRRIVFLGDPEAAHDVDERWQALEHAFQAAGLPAPGKPVPCELQQPAGHAAAAALLDEGARPDAIMCANDEIALGVYAAARERDLAIPDDLAVTGWDDVPAAQLVSPPLTTAHQPLRELGARSAEHLLARVAGDRDHASVVLPTTLMIRASSGSPESPTPGGALT